MKKKTNISEGCKIIDNYVFHKRDCIHCCSKKQEGHTKKCGMQEGEDCDCDFEFTQDGRPIISTQPLTPAIKGEITN